MSGNHVYTVSSEPRINRDSQEKEQKPSICKSDSCDLDLWIKEYKINKGQVLTKTD